MIHIPNLELEEQLGKYILRFAMEHLAHERLSIRHDIDGLSWYFNDGIDFLTTHLMINFPTELTDADVDEWFVEHKDDPVNQTQLERVRQRIKTRLNFDPESKADADDLSCKPCGGFGVVNGEDCPCCNGSGHKGDCDCGKTVG